MTDPKTLILQRTFEAPQSQVFEAWRNPKIMAQWFSAPDSVATVVSDFRVGGSYRIQLQSAHGQSYVQYGEYLVIEPESRLVFSWTCHEIGVLDSVVTVELKPCGAATKMTLTHLLPPDPELWRPHQEGWIRCLSQLDKILTENVDTGRR